jgi:hypothetical protein
LGQVSESATTWQIFRKIEYAAGMPQVILSAAREQAEQSDPQALQWVSPQRALRLASSIGGWRMEERTDLSSARWVTNKLEERGHMSSQNGDKARFNRLRKQKFRRRELMARLATQSAASAARLGKTLPAKLAQR